MCLGLQNTKPQIVTPYEFFITQHQQPLNSQKIDAQTFDNHRKNS